MNQNDDCLFCKIAKKEIPADIVYEDDISMVFLDINPVHKGHLLVIPKEHYPWIQDTPDALVASLFVTAKRLIQAMRTGIQTDYVQVGVVGTEIPHFHIHLIPRTFSDKLPASMRDHEPYANKSEQDDFASRIKNAL